MPPAPRRSHWIWFPFLHRSQAQLSEWRSCTAYSTTAATPFSKHCFATGPEFIALWFCKPEVLYVLEFTIMLSCILGLPFLDGCRCLTANKANLPMWKAPVEEATFAEAKAWWSKNHKRWRSNGNALKENCSAKTGEEPHPTMWQGWQRWQRGRTRRDWKRKKDGEGGHMALCPAKSLPPALQTRFALT